MCDLDKIININPNANNIFKRDNFLDNELKNFEGSYNEFFHNFLILNQPCIIRNVTSSWKCTKLWVNGNGPDINFLRDQYGNSTVTVADCNQKYYNSHLKTCIKFKEFADYWMNLIQNNYPPCEPCLYLKDWHFTKDFPQEMIYSVPPEFSNDWLNEFFTSQKNLNDDYRFVYMGPKGSWTPFHVDVFTSYSWSVNICGEKKWILLPPGEESKLKDKFGNLLYDICTLENLKDIDSKMKDIKFKIVIQKAGDAIFVPSGWHHQVWNTRDTISINHNWINACNINNMWSSMKTNFEEVKKEISQFKNSMDDWDDHCQRLLKSCFGMDFQDFYNFLLFIMERRKNCVKNKTELEVYGGWKLSINHLQYDLGQLNEIINIFLNYPEVKSCIKSLSC